MEHSFDVDIAREYGIPAAILLKQMSLWINVNKRKGKNQFNGKTWTYNSSRDLSDKLPYFSAQVIKRTLLEMVRSGLLERGNFNKTAQDRTIWYTLTDKAEALISHCSKRNNALRENEQSIVQNGTMESTNPNNALFKNEPPLPSKYTSKNTSNNTSISPPIIPPAGDCTSKSEPKADSHTQTRREILAYLNGKAGTKYRDGAVAKRHIDARLNEGYTLDDFKSVIDAKCREWLGSDMAKYLRPETLFGTKFDGYLGAANVASTERGENGITIDRGTLLDRELAEIFGGE